MKRAVWSFADPSMTITTSVSAGSRSHRLRSYSGASTISMRPSQDWCGLDPRRTLHPCPPAHRALPRGVAAPSPPALSTTLSPRRGAGRCLRALSSSSIVRGLCEHDKPGLHAPGGLWGCANAAGVQRGTRPRAREDPVSSSATKWGKRPCGIPPVARTHLPYAALACRILPSSNSAGLM